MARCADRDTHPLAHGRVDRRKADEIQDAFNARRRTLGMDRGTNLHAWRSDRFIGGGDVHPDSPVDDDKDCRHQPMVIGTEQVSQEINHPPLKFIAKYPDPPEPHTVPQNFRLAFRLESHTHRR